MMTMVDRIDTAADSVSVRDAEFLADKKRVTSRFFRHRLTQRRR